MYECVCFCLYLIFLPWKFKVDLNSKIILAWNRTFNRTPLPPTHKLLDNISGNQRLIPHYFTFYTPTPVTICCSPSLLFHPLRLSAIHRILDIICLLLRMQRIPEFLALTFFDFSWQIVVQQTSKIYVNWWEVLLQIHWEK